MERYDLFVEVEVGVALDLNLSWLPDGFRASSPRSRFS